MGRYRRQRRLFCDDREVVRRVIIMRCLHIGDSDSISSRFVYQIVVPRQLAPKDLVEIFDSGSPIVLPPWDPMASALIAVYYVTSSMISFSGCSCVNLYSGRKLPGFIFLYLCCTLLTFILTFSIYYGFSRGIVTFESR